MQVLVHEDVQFTENIKIHIQNLRYIWPQAQLLGWSYTHTSAQCSPLVWGLLRLAPTNLVVNSLNELTISVCSHGCTSDTVTFCILSPHPHTVLSGGSEAIQSCGEDISCNHLCLK